MTHVNVVAAETNAAIAPRRIIFPHVSLSLLQKYPHTSEIVFLRVTSIILLSRFYQQLHRRRNALSVIAIDINFSIT
jgi:hypothetical protein